MTQRPTPSTLSHLDWLEAEAIHIMREVAGQCSNPVLLFSGGKDSICMLRIAEKAFRPGRFPFPLMHIDTGHNYQEVVAFRDKRAAELGERLIVAQEFDDTVAAARVGVALEGGEAEVVARADAGIELIREVAETLDVQTGDMHPDCVSRYQNRSKPHVDGRRQAPLREL